MIGLLVWLCTYKCNLNCRHCYVKGRSVNEINTKTAIKMIKEIAEVNPRHFSITGGEPLIRRDIFTLLREARDYNLNTSIVTNGFHINRDVAEKLYQLEVYVYLSMDAGRKETCNLIRGIGAWSKIMEAAKTLRERGIEFSTIMTVMPENYHETKSFIEKSIEIGAEHSALIPIIPSGNAKNKILDPMKIVEAYSSAEAAAEDYGYYISFWCSPFLRYFRKSKYVYIGKCSDNALDIDPAGNTLVCDVLEIKTSNVIDKGLLTAIREHFNHPIILELKDPSNLKGKCATCKYKSECGGGCKARAYLIYGDFNLPDPCCPLGQAPHKL